MKQTNIDIHNKCHCEIRWKQFKGKSEATPGLFCKHHDVFLDWLSIEHATLLIDNGISEAPYIDRKIAKKTKKSKTKFYQIAKRNEIKAKTKIFRNKQTLNLS